jgi:hypothetical protein
MASRRWLAGVGTVLLLLVGGVGCKGTDLALFFQAPLGPEDRVLPGSVETVAASIQSKIKNLGIDARVTREGEFVKVAATTPEGRVFNVVLSRRKTDTGEATQVRWEWDPSIDVTFKGQIKEQVAPQTPVKP